MGLSVNASSNAMNYSYSLPEQFTGTEKLNTIFGTQKATPKTKEAKEAEAKESARFEKIQKGTQKISSKNNMDRLVKSADEIERKLRDSSVPYMPQIGKFIANMVNSLKEGIGGGTFKLQSLKDISAQDLDKAINGAVADAQNLSNQAAAYVARGLKAVELEKVYTVFINKGGDPQTINMEKVYYEITKPIEIKQPANEKQAEDKTENKNDENISGTEAQMPNLTEMLKNDKISQITDKLIKYLKNGEKEDNEIDEFLNKKLDNKNKSLADNKSSMGSITAKDNPVESVSFFTSPIKIG